MKKYLLLALYALSFGFITATNIMEVMSYNARRKGKDPQEFQWDNRKKLLLDMVLSKKPAIIGFQEVVEGQQSIDLENGLKPFDYQSFGDARNTTISSKYQEKVSGHKDAKNERNPIFYDTKKLNLIASGNFGINPVGHIFTASLPRIVTWGQFEDKDSKKQFYLYNTHLSSSGWWGLKDGTELIRNKQILMILEHVAKNTDNLPVIIMGDFNTKIEGDIKKNLAKALFKDAREKAQIVKGPQETRTGWNDNELKEIDHILVKNADVTEYEVIKSPEGVYPSDHRPVVAKIVLQ